MPTREQLTTERLNALIVMWKEGGRTPAGDPPSDEHIGTLKEVTDVGEAREVADAHKADKAPPDVGGGG